MTARKIALGSIELQPVELAAIAYARGEAGVANHEAARSYVLIHGFNGIERAVADLKQHLAAVERDLTTA